MGKRETRFARRRELQKAVKILFIFLILVVITACSFSIAIAKDNYTTLFNNRYGTSGVKNGTTLGSCITCHYQLGGKGGENAYALDYRNNGHDFAAIEPFDSDNDGFTNLAEINAGTFPGDPASRPVPTPMPPIANAGPDQTVNEGATVMLDGSNSSDPDDGIASYIWVQTAGPQITLTSTTALQPTFTAPNVGPSGSSLTFQLTVTDNGGLQSTDTCIVNVSWVNQPPVADAGLDQTVSEGNTVMLDGSNSSDPDDGIASYLWTQTGGLPVTLTNTTAIQPTFTAPNVGPSGSSLTFQLTVTDNGGLQSTDTCIVNVSWVNQPPVADAGFDQTVNEGDTVMLDASNSSDPDDGIASYLWAQTGGLPVTLTNTTAIQPTFTAPNVGSSGASLTFQLTVTDSGGLQSTDTCLVDVSPVNQPPTANAGPDQIVNEGDTVMLDGSNSTDLDDGIAAYQWQQTGGPSVILSDPLVPAPTFTAPTVGSGGVALTFMLTVTDSAGQQNSDTCTVNVSNNNIPPTANAGPDQTVDEGVTVMLDGSNSSDPDDGIASYQWIQTAGPAVALSSASMAQPTFTAPNVGPSGISLTFQLTVTDNAGLQSTDACIVNVAWVNLPPVADAGPDQSAEERITVMLDGSNSSDPDDGIASYQWIQTAGPAVALSSATAVQPTFTTPNVNSSGVSLGFQLTVRDIAGLQATDTTVVNVSWINLPPVADAGPDQSVDEGVTVTLDGSNSSDPDDGISSYLWQQTGGPPVTLSSTTVVQPTFIAPTMGVSGASLTFQLTVTDSAGLQSTDTSIVNVSWVNQPPTADAGPDQTVSEGRTVTLDGSNSSDPDGAVGSYLWAQTAGPQVTLSNAAAMRPTFVTPVVDPAGAALTFRLTVGDNAGLQSSDEVSIVVGDNGITSFPTDVLSLITSSGQPMGIKVASGGQLIGLNTIDPSTVESTVGMPENLNFGLLDIKVKADTPGGTATVVVYLPQPAPEGYRWYKYSSTNGWTDFSTWAVFSPTRDQVTLTLTDGGAGDDDGLRNGVIADPSGLGTSPSTPAFSVAGNEWGGGGSGCFIGTTSGVLCKEPLSLTLSTILIAGLFFMSLQRECHRREGRSTK
jgi:hypothetical protein